MNIETAQGYYPVVFGMLSGSATLPENEARKDFISSYATVQNVYYISEFGEMAKPEDAPEGSVAIINLSGAITKGDQWCGGSGTATKANLIERAVANPNVIGLVLQIDSGGGQIAAVEKITSVIEAASKPIVAFVDGMAASAAYWIASYCDRIMMFGNNSRVGSIGAYVSYTDFTRYYAEKGIDIYTVYAPQSTLKNKAFNDMLKKDEASMKAELKQEVDIFISELKVNRPELADAPDSVFQGAMFTSDQAVTNGLADDKGSLADAIKLVDDLAEGNKSFQPLNSNLYTNMKFPIAATNAALIAALGLTIPAGADAVEIELTADHLVTINKALTDAAAAQKTAEDGLVTEKQTVTTVTGERDALQARLNTTPAVAPAAPVAEQDDIPNAGPKKEDPFYSDADEALKQARAGQKELPEYK